MANVNPRSRSGDGGGEYPREPETHHAATQPQPLHTEHLEHKVTELYHQMENLVETQLKLARTELSEKIDQVKKGVGSISTGGALAFFGGQALIAGLVLLLNTWIGTLWISALIVGAVLALIGLMMIAGGKKAMKPENLKPERTMRSIQEDREAVRRRVQ